jgi:hypothetical protein
MKKLLLMVVGCAFVCPSEAQQMSTDVLTVLRASLAAQSGPKVIQDITLTGNAESVADSDETASFSFKGTLSGSARTDINLTSGIHTEIRTMGSSGPTGTWSKGDGQKLALAGHNMMTDPAWCTPVLVVERLLSNPADIISYIGTEDGLAHFRSYQPAPASTPAASSGLVAHLSQIDLYLDPKTFLPVKLSFNTHPDNNALVDLPVLVAFSNYQTSNGVTAPMHIQQYLNGSLALDIQVGSVVVNSGLSAANL